MFKKGVDEGALSKLKNKTNVRRAGTRRIARNKATINELQGSLNANPKFTKMVEYSVECLTKLAVDETSVDEMLEEGVLDTLLKIMSLNPYNEKIMQLINKALQAFCVNEEIAKKIGAKLGGSPFVNSLKKHTEPETIVSTLKTMSMISCSPENIDSLVNAGAVNAIAAVVKNNPEEEDVLSHAAAFLDKVADHRDNAKKVMDTGVVEKLLEGMKTYPDNAHLVENSVSLIAKLAVSSPEILDSLKRLGTVDIIVNALEYHPDNEPLLKSAEECLRALAGEEDIQGTLKVKAGNNMATAAAMAKLSSLMLVPENIDFMIQNQGVEWLLAALQSALGDHSDISQKILESGCRAVGRMAKDEKKIYAMMNKGGVKLLTSIINEHVDEEKVAASSLNALAKLVTRKENAVFITKSGGVQAAVNAQNKHPNSEPVAKAALDFFQRMAAHEETVPTMVDKGAIESTVGILNNHNESPEIVSGAINTLGRMATSAENMEKMANAGALQAVVDALVSQTDELPVAKQAVLMIETAAMLPANIEKLRDAGAVDAILKTLEVHPDDEELQQIAIRTLGVIAGDQQLKTAVDNVQTTADQILAAPGTTKALIDKFERMLNLLGDFSLVDDNKGKLVGNGAVKALIAAFEAANTKMPKGPQRDRAMHAAAQGLQRLASDPKAAEQILKAGMVGKLLNAAAANPQNEGLGEAAMELASSLANNPLFDPKSISSIIECAKAFPENPGVLKAASDALASLATTPANCAEICRLGGAGVMCEALLANPDHAAEMIRNLAKLAVDEASIKALVAAGAIDAILEALRRFHDDPNVVAACIQALCTLVIDSEIAKEVGDKGGCDLLVRAMRDHYTREGIAEMDMVLLDSLASVAENAEKMLEEELQTVDLVKWMMETYSSNTPLNEAGTRLLNTLEPSNTIAAMMEGADGGVAKLTAEQADEVIAQLTRGDLNEAQMLALLGNVGHLCTDADNSGMLITRGGLLELANIMKNNHDNEAVYMAAAGAFANMAEHCTDPAILAHPSIVQAMCDLMKPRDNFKSALNLDALTKGIVAAAKMKLTPELAEEFIKNQPFESLLNLLCEADDDLLLANAARLLAMASNNDDIAALLAQIANLRELIAAMRRHFKNQEFLKYGVYLLANMALTDELKNQIGIEGGIQLILMIMETYPENQALIENCAYALANLSYENEINCSFIVACSGIQHLLTAMATHNQVEDLLESSVCVLCNLCHENDNNKDKICKAGGAHAVVEAVLNNFHSLDLVISSFRTLGNLAYSTEAIKTIVESGAVQGIVAGMTVHNEELDIIDLAVRVLSNLASDMDPEVQTTMEQEGAVQAIVEVVDTYSNNLDLCVPAFECLNHFAVTKNNAAVIIKQGGTEAVLKAISALNHDIQCVGEATKLISVLALSTDNLDRMLAAGVVLGLVEVAKAHPQAEAVICSCLTAIGRCAYNDKTARSMANDGACNLCLSALNANMQNPIVLIACYQALSGLCRSEKNASEIAGTVMNRMTTNLATHVSHPDCLTVAFSFLGNLCIHPSAVEQVLKSEIVDAVNSSLLSHPAVPQLVIRGCRALEHMALGSKEVRTYLKDGRSIDTMEKLKAMSTRSDIINAAQNVIDAINRVDFNIVSLPFVTFSKPQTMTKSAKTLFGDIEKNQSPELSRAARNFLTAGTMITKHSMTAAPRARHLFVSQDLKWLVWKDPHQKIQEGQRMKTHMLKSIEVGRVTPQLQRKRFGKFLAQEDCCFTIQGRQRTVDVEADSPAERDKWIDHLENLMRYSKAVKQAAKTFDGVGPQ
mmetsp:Transcript_8936/g.17084  ORF Transcript_8936/g.17084 Transcript_8936/m.17084 type:complete len:1795 (+) Transcript_8936:30-5414(+)|eukprot:CAMPEP_0175152908 /NCGR_PEP_ID=MMETSP0087-20121206/19405_1 /TAXON_ID=136419 /ORGANISM="Unknown Unknown, Strain D1" /LENGTH=1794 /DNA_ID=CAMNT_0016439453 /DNA_START=30 /DNA_END=5414 /DNA_ORIENTATION=+